MKAFYADCFVLPLPEGHRFPMEKYRDEEIVRAHDPEHLRKVRTG